MYSAETGRPEARTPISEGGHSQSQPWKVIRAFGPAWGMFGWERGGRDRDGPFSSVKAERGPKGIGQGAFRRILPENR